MNVTGDYFGGPSTNRVCVNCGEREELEKVEFQANHSDEDPLGISDELIIGGPKFILCYACVRNATQRIETIQRKRWRGIEREFNELKKSMGLTKT